MSNDNTNNIIGSTADVAAGANSASQAPQEHPDFFVRISCPKFRCPDDVRPDIIAGILHQIGLIANFTAGSVLEVAATSNFGTAGAAHPAVTALINIAALAERTSQQMEEAVRQQTRARLSVVPNLNANLNPLTPSPWPK